MKSVISAKEAAALVKDGMSLAVGGFVGNGVPEDLLIALRERYLETKSPRDLTITHVAGMGDSKTRGVTKLGVEGLIKKIYCAHVGLEPDIGKLAVENKLAAFIVPQGVVAQMMRAIGSGKPGVITNVGLKTYADPRNEGCKVNDAARAMDDIVEVITIGGKEQLFYKAFPIDICFIKASYADEDGNLTLHNEAAHIEQFEMAIAAHNSGGIVIAQVEKIVQRNTLHPQVIKVPGVIVDYIVGGDPKNNYQHYFSVENRPECSGDARIPVSEVAIEKMGPRKVIGRRGAFELKPGMLVNLGIGVPDSVASVANEEGIVDRITLTIENGVMGGIPLPGLGIGVAVNPVAIVKEPDMFDLYDGGGIDLSCLGAAEIDEKGNVNVSKFAGRFVGPGGFINISQNAKEVCFCGTFTAGKAEYEIKDGRLNIIRDGEGIKFVKKVEQITFSGEYAAESGQTILYLTERAVFRLTGEGIVLTEIAPGVDLEKHILAKMEFKPLVAKDLKTMDQRIFRDQPMGLKI
jgi:propionate CoA-transferase